MSLKTDNKSGLSFSITSILNENANKNSEKMSSSADFDHDDSEISNIDVDDVSFQDSSSETCDESNPDSNENSTPFYSNINCLTSFNT